MHEVVELSRPLNRLSAELDDDGVAIDADARLRVLILEELEYARRPRQFESRVPLYGAMIVPDDRSLVASGELADLVDLSGRPLGAARRFADGRSSFLTRSPDGSQQLACFRRSIMFESDMVEIQADTGAFVVQRTPVLGVTRLFTTDTTIEWSGYRWTTRPNAAAEHAALRPLLPEVPSSLLRGMLDLAIHWLSPGRVGATLLLPGEHGLTGLDVDHATVPPPLSVTSRGHYAPLYAALSQTDLATALDQEGTVRRIGVALRPSRAADAATNHVGGMRHRSAAGYTYDHPGALAIVVSEDGPVTVLHEGRALSTCAPRQGAVAYS